MCTLPTWEVFIAKIDKARFWTGVLYPENMGRTGKRS